MLKGKNFVRALKIAMFPLLFIYLEVIYKVSVKSGFSTDFFYPCISAVTLGLAIMLLSALGNKLVNRIVGYTLTSVVCILFSVQIVYTNTFIAPFSLSIAFGGAEGVAALTEFKDLTVTAIFDNILWIILCLLPVVVVVIADIKLNIFNRKYKWSKLCMLLALVEIHVIGVLTLYFGNSDGYSPKVLYFEQFVIDIGFDKLGVITSTKLDIKNFIFGATEKLDDITDKQEIPDLGEKPTENNTEKPTVNEEPSTGDEPSTGETETPDTETPEPIVYEPNVLKIDLDAFSANTSDDNIKWLNDYIAACEPTMKNEYTGMFEGYNLILLTAESFSPWAVSEKYTPTLYKLVNSGFVFNNFYLPIEIIKTTYVEQKKTKVTYGKEELKQILINQLEEQFEEEGINNLNVVNKIVNVYEKEKNIIELEMTYEVQTTIGTEERFK